jgi:hypothetical protein
MLNYLVPPLGQMSFAFYFLYERISGTELLKSLHELSLGAVIVLMVSAKKQLFFSVHRAFILENTLSVAAFLSGIA